MKVKTNELLGAELDWAVAKCEGVSVAYDRMNGWWETSDSNYAEPNDPEVFNPTTNWSQGGPIIEREKIDVMWGGDRWCAYTMTPDKELQLQTEGATPLLAAMRGYVASRLGFEVEVPEEIIGR